MPPASWCPSPADSRPIIAAVPQAEPIVRGAILPEPIVRAWPGAGSYGGERSRQALRAEGVDPDEYGPLSFVGTLQPVTRTRLAQARGLRRATPRRPGARPIGSGPP